MKIFSLSRILGRQGLVKNFYLSKTKNYLREDYYDGVVTSNNERNYYLENFGKTAYNALRYRRVKN
jgi:hypothetical protein